MFTGTISKHVLHAALLALVCGPAAVHAQSAKSPSESASEGSAVKSSSSQDTGSSAGSSAGASSGAGSAASGAGAPQGKVSAADRRLMQQIAQANIAEIETGKLAQSKSQNDEVKNFAQRMIDDHTKALEDLQQVAQAKGVTLPTTPDAKHRAMAKKLNALSGDKFDRMYMTQGGVTDHRQTHQLLERAQARATDPDVKQVVEQTLPVVQQHLTMAQQLHASIKSGGTSAGASGTGGATSSGTGATGAPGAGSTGSSGSQGSTPGGTTGSGSGK